MDDKFFESSVDFSNGCFENVSTGKKVYGKLKSVHPKKKLFSRDSVLNFVQTFYGKMD